MTQPQPNERAAALRMALDLIENHQRTMRGHVDGTAAIFSTDQERAAIGFAIAMLSDGVVDALQDQLLEAGGFLGDAPEPETRVTVRGWTVCLEEPGYAWFERDSDGTGGGLWFEGDELVDYDGVSCLPSAVADGIRSLGLTVPADME